MLYNEETSADALQAWSEARHEADVEQAEMHAYADRGHARIHALRQQGKCAHQSAVFYIPTPVYPGQIGLKPGQSRCTDGCGRIFNSDQEQQDAEDQAWN